MKLNLSALLQQLTQFGLNPREWRVEVTNAQGRLAQLQLRSKGKRSLALSGWAHEDRWIKLSLNDF